MEIGQKIKFLREQRGLSLRGLAIKCKTIAHTTILRIEENSTDPTLSTLKELANAFNINITELLSEESEKVPKGEILGPKTQEAIALLKQIDEKNLSTVIGFLQGAVEIQKEIKGENL